MNKLTISAEAAGTRLDRALRDLEPTLSRQAWQNLIKQAKVSLNGQPVSDSARIVSAGDIIAYELPRLSTPAPEVKTLYQDDDVIVYDKPAGLLTHSKGGLLEEWTLAEIARPLVQTDASNRPGIVHRLDRATSGVIILARHDSAKDWLQRQFAQRQVGKTYQAIVWGRPQSTHYTIDLPLARDHSNPKKFTVSAQGRPAITAVRTLKSAANASWLELKPTTGRTHQLRVHLAATATPIVGDALYGRTTGDSASRMYLHALSLRLTLPNGQSKTFRAALPPDFQRGLETHGLA